MRAVHPLPPLAGASSLGLPDWMWWPQLERLALAYEDLHCEEVL